jgi:hypothetical protein
VSEQISFIRKWNTEKVEIWLEIEQRTVSPNIEAVMEARKAAQDAPTGVNH